MSTISKISRKSTGKVKVEGEKEKGAVQQAMRVRKSIVKIRENVRKVGEEASRNKFGMESIGSREGKDQRAQLKG